MVQRKLFLYIKISPKGLFYLGKFIERETGSYLNVYTYKGSGTYWKRHLKNNNFNTRDLQTIVLHEAYDEIEIKKLGLYYSKLFDIVNSKLWANLVEENGEGCCNILDKEMIERRSLKLRGKRGIEYKCPHCLLEGRGHNMLRYHFNNCPFLTGKRVDEEIECPHCKIRGSKGNMKKWHFEKCRILKEFQVEKSKTLKDDKWKFPSKNRWNLNKLTKDRMSTSKSIAILQMDLFGNEIKVWKSAKDASLNLKIGRSNITACCKGRREIAGPFKWKYK